MKTRFVSVAAALAVSTIISSAFAEDKATLSTVTVTGDAPQTTTAPSEAASRESLRQIAGSTAVVGRGEYEDSRAATVKDMLDYVPGVFAQSRINEESRLSIRGSGLSRTFHMRGLSIYQDGIPVHYADGSADFQDIDPLAFSHAEVYKGANALHLGAATLGGAINFVTPTGHTADPLSLRLEGGSFGTMRGNVQGGKVVGDSDVFASFSRQVSDGFRDHSRQNNSRFYGNVGHKLSDQLETRFYLTYIDANQELPGAITKDQLRADPTQANAFSEIMNYQRDYELWRVANKTTWSGDGYTLSGGAYYIWKDLDHPIFQVVDQRNKDVGAFANITFEGERNTLLLGTDLRNGRTDSRRFVNLSGGYGAPTSSAKETSNTATFYAEDRYRVTDAVTLIGGAQFLYTERESDDQFLANGDQSGKKSYHGISPKIGALWDVSPTMQLFGNLSASYEPPTFSELTQMLPGVTTLADIEAQKAYTLEIGTRGSHGRYRWDVAAYRAWLKDEMMMFATGPTTSGVLNADDTIHQGIELGFGVDITDTISTRAAYTWSDFHFDDDVQWGDNEIPGMPEHYLRAELRYTDPNGWYVAPNVEAALDNYYVDMANIQQADAYALLGLTAGVDVTENASLFVDLRNLTDEKYAATTNVVTTVNAMNSALYIPGDGRSVYAGLKYRF
jgi:iron complex outermembrane recepter protein